MSEGAFFVHATVVTVGEQGVFIEGPAGSGKSSLAAALLDDAAMRRRCGRLVGDDRVSLAAAHGRLIARPHPAIAGLLEQRGLGLVARASEPAAVVHLVVRLVTGPGAGLERLPDAAATRVLAGIALPVLLLAAQAGSVENARRVTAALQRLSEPANKLANSTAMHNIAPHEAAGGHVAEST